MFSQVSVCNKEWRKAPVQIRWLDRASQSSENFTFSHCHHWLHRCRVWLQSGSDWPRIEQIQTYFLDQIFLHFGPVSRNVLKSDLKKSSGLVTCAANLTTRAGMSDRENIGPDWHKIGIFTICQNIWYPWFWVLRRKLAIAGRAVSDVNIIQIH